MSSIESRRIRSFVKRAGRMTTGQRRAWQDLWPLYGLENISTVWHPEQLFGRKAPITLEIGFGNGDNLVDMAQAAPECDFIGIEVHKPGVGHCLLRIEEQQLSNVRVVCHDAVEVINNCIADASLNRVNLFFPDPWHKKRHHKRRIVQLDFMALLARKLTAGGLFHVATDWSDYADHIVAIMCSSPEFELLPNPPQDRPVSRFDSRGARLGHQNWERAWCKRSKLCFSG